MTQPDYLIRCDMEGIGGVVRYEQVEPGTAEYPQAAEWLADELSALVEGLQQGGAGRIVVYDMHWHGRNLDEPSWPQVEILAGKPPYRDDWPGGLDESFAGLILLGLHAKAGTPDALLPHSYEHEIADIRLGGVSVGEIGMEAAIAGDLDVPTVLVIGDTPGMAEATQLMPNVATVSVKGRPNDTPIRSDATEAIRRAAVDVVRNPPRVEPYRAGEKTQLSIRFHDGRFLETLRRLHADRMDDDHTLTLAGGNATTLWARYGQIKEQCRKAL